MQPNFGQGSTNSRDGISGPWAVAVCRHAICMLWTGIVGAQSNSCSSYTSSVVFLPAREIKHPVWGQPLWAVVFLSLRGTETAAPYGQDLTFSAQLNVKRHSRGSEDSPFSTLTHTARDQQSDPVQCFCGDNYFHAQTVPLSCSCLKCPSQFCSWRGPLSLRSWVAGVFCAVMRGGSFGSRCTCRGAVLDLTLGVVTSNPPLFSR